MPGATSQLCSVTFSRAYASFNVRGLAPEETPPLLFWPANIDRFLTPNSSISASRALFALVPVSYTHLTLPTSDLV